MTGQISQTDIDRRPNPKPQLCGGRAPGIHVSSIDFIGQNPLDVFWRVAIAENYERERICLNELHLSVPGHWCDHHVALSWCPEEEMLKLFLAFDSKVPGGRSDHICRLMALINERLCVGHFDYWGLDDSLVYRDAVLLSGKARLGAAQAMAMIASALSAAEKGYPACQYVLWAGMSPEEALDTAIVEKAARS